MVKFSKNRKGEMILEITPPSISFKGILKFFLFLLMNIFTPLFNFFDLLAEKRKLVISAVGLGLGLGLSIIVTQRPDILQAVNTQFCDDKVIVTELSIPRIGLYNQVSPLNTDDLTRTLFNHQLLQLTKFGSLTSSYPVVITNFNPFLSLSLDEVMMGDEVVVTGSNQGRYIFKVVDIREIESEYLPQVTALYSHSLIIYAPLNILRTRILVVIAR